MKRVKSVKRNVRFRRTVEGDFWRDIAAKLEQGTFQFLCLAANPCVAYTPPEFAYERLSLFSPTKAKWSDGPWWMTNDNSETNAWTCRHRGYDATPDGRILAACFLAAMADSGEKI